VAVALLRGVVQRLREVQDRMVGGDPQATEDVDM
jgi:hypothetical protein